MMIFISVLFYCIISVTSNDPEPIRVTGQGYHRKLEIELGTTEMKNALLKWEITPDFYVDVYELKRLGFEFRVDGGQTPFIEIEEPSHKSSFHSLSLNIHKANNSIPFHLRYQVTFGGFSINLNFRVIEHVFGESDFWKVLFSVILTFREIGSRIVSMNHLFGESSFSI